MQYRSAGAAARDMLVRDVDGNLHIGLPIKFAEEPGRVHPQVPGLGEHTAEVLRDAGCDEETIREVCGG